MCVAIQENACENLNLVIRFLSTCQFLASGWNLWTSMPGSHRVTSGSECNMSIRSYIFKSALLMVQNDVLICNQLGQCLILQVILNEEWYFQGASQATVKVCVSSHTYTNFDLGIVGPCESVVKRLISKNSNCPLGANNTFFAETSVLGRKC